MALWALLRNLKAAKASFPLFFSQIFESLALWRHLNPLNINSVVICIQAKNLDNEQQHRLADYDSITQHFEKQLADAENIRADTQARVSDRW